MKRLLTILFLCLISYYSIGQYINLPTAGSSTTGNTWKGGIFADSSISILSKHSFADTTAANFSVVSKYSGIAIYTTSDSSYWIRKLNPNKWNKFNTSAASLSSISQGYGILNTPNPITTTGTVASDTTVMVSKNYFSNIAVKYWDTSLMLNPYLLKSDTAAMLSNRLKISDTANMLVPYVRNDRTISTNAPLFGGGDLSANRTFGIDTGRANAQIPSGGDLNKVRDSLVGLISGGGFGTVLNVSTTDGVGIISSVTNPTSTPDIAIRVDTLTISTRAWRQKGDDSLGGLIALKVNISDTANMLIPYLLKSDTATMLAPFVQYSDTAYMLSNRLKISDTAYMLSNRLKISDTATMLVNRLKISDTATMLSGYTRVQRFLDTTLVLRTLINTKGTGTVTSVALSLPAMFSVSGSPVTTNGTLTASLANQTSNTVFAGPTTGSPAQPTFRTLTTSDIPNSYVKYTDTSSMLAGYQRHFIFNTKDYGAYGDNVHDDQPAIQAAIDAAVPVSGVVLIQGSAGLYFKLNDSLTISNGVRLVGLGSQTTVLMPNHNRAYSINVINSGSQLENFFLDCNGSSSGHGGSSGGILIRSSLSSPTSFQRIFNVNVSSRAEGFTIDGTASQISTIWATNCDFFKDSTSGYGVSARNIRHLFFSSCNFFGIAGNNNIYIDSLSNNIHFNGGIITGFAEIHSPRTYFSGIYGNTLYSYSTSLTVDGGEMPTIELKTISTNNRINTYVSTSYTDLGTDNSLSTQSAYQLNNRRIPFINSFGQLKDTVGFNFQSSILNVPGSISISTNTGAPLTLNSPLGQNTNIEFNQNNISKYYLRSLDGGGFSIYDVSLAKTLQLFSTTGSVTFSDTVTASSFVKSGGTSSQILAADGSVITAGTNISISGGIISSSNTGGTITSIATNNGTGITGGTITTSGTLTIDTTNLSTRIWRQKGIDSVMGQVVLKLNISDTSTMLNKLTIDRVLQNGNSTGRSINSGAISISTTSTPLVLNYAGTGNTNIEFQENGATKYYLRSLSGGRFSLYDNTLAKTLQLFSTTGSVTFSDTATASSFVKSGGTSTQSLMANGSVLTVSSSNTASAIVQRDGSGNFSANIITGSKFIGNSASDNGVDAIQSGGGSILGNLYRSEGKVQASNATIDATATVWNDNTNGSTVTYTLPSTSSLQGGKYMFIKTGTGNLTLSGTIVKKDGTSAGGSMTLASTDGMQQFWFDGTTWYQIN